MYRVFLLKYTLTPIEPPEPLSILNPSDFVPKSGFPVVKGLNQPPAAPSAPNKTRRPKGLHNPLYLSAYAATTKHGLIWRDGGLRHTRANTYPRLSDRPIDRLIITNPTIDHRLIDRPLPMIIDQFSTRRPTDQSIH